jgi:hypothetical protein
MLRKKNPFGIKGKKCKRGRMDKAIKGKLKDLTEAYKKLLAMWVLSRNVFIMVQLV